MSETSPNVVIPGFMPGIQNAAISLRLCLARTMPAGMRGPLDPGDKPRDDTRRGRPTLLVWVAP
jgi:hypothetical protein